MEEGFMIFGVSSYPRLFSQLSPPSGTSHQLLLDNFFSGLPTGHTVLGQVDPETTALFQLLNNPFPDRPSPGPVDSSLLTKLQTELSDLGQFKEAATTFKTALKNVATPTASPIPDNLQSTAAAFVSAFNNIKGKLGSLGGSSGEPAGNNLVNLFTGDLQGIIGNGTSGTDGTTSLAHLGILMQSDGTLSLNKATLKTAATADAAGTGAALSGAATSFVSLADRFAGSGGIIEAVASSVQNSLATAQ